MAEQQQVDSALYLLSQCHCHDTGPQQCLNDYHYPPDTTALQLVPFSPSARVSGGIIELSTLPVNFGFRHISLRAHARSEMAK